MKKPLRIGLIGYSFMGRAHSNAFHQVNHFFPSSYEVIPQAVCGRDETKVKVRKAMKALGYRPNFIARSLVRSRTRTIALITPDLNPHVRPIIRGVANGATKWDYALMLIPMDTWLEEDRSVSFVATPSCSAAVRAFSVATAASATAMACVANARLATSLTS